MIDEMSDEVTKRLKAEHGRDIEEVYGKFILTFCKQYMRCLLRGDKFKKEIE